MVEMADGRGGKRAPVPGGVKAPSESGGSSLHRNQGVKRNPGGQASTGFGCLPPAHSLLRRELPDEAGEEVVLGVARAEAGRAVQQALAPRLLHALRVLPPEIADVAPRHGTRND